MNVINNYDTYIALLNKVNVQQNGEIGPARFNGWYNETSLTLFKKFGALYDINQQIEDLLAPFIKEVNVIIAPQTGQSWGLAVRPTDFEYLVNAALIRQKTENTCFGNDALPIIDQNGKSHPFVDPTFAGIIQNFAGANTVERLITKIDAQRWSSCLDHPSKGPTFDNPKMTQYNNGFKVAPKGITVIILKYLSTPISSVFNGSISDADIFIYNPATSQQLQWSQQVQPWFLAMLVTKYGLYINDTNIVQMGEEMLKLLEVSING
jgi:hypothetical protein